MSNDLKQIYEQKVFELKSQLENNLISQSEYDELLQDLMDVKKIEKRLATEKVKITAAQVLEVIKAAAKVL